MKPERATRFLKMNGVTHAMGFMKGLWVAWCGAETRYPRAFPWTHRGPASCLFCIEVGCFSLGQEAEDVWQFNPTGRRYPGLPGRQAGKSTSIGGFYGNYANHRNGGPTFFDTSFVDAPYAPPVPFQWLRKQLVWKLMLDTSGGE